MHKDFNEFLKLLNCHKVRYVIVGGYALGAYLIPRTTKDLDILIEATERNAIKLIHALKDFGFGSLGLKITDFTEPAFTIQLGYEPVRIDISTSITGVEWNEIWANKKRVFRQVAYASLLYRNPAIHKEQKRSWQAYGLNRC